MARISQEDFSGQSETSNTKTLNIDAMDQQFIEVPSNDFISDAEMSRAGQDLVLEVPNGDVLVINNYFMADPAPMIESPDGSILTSNLVHSFLNSPAQFAQVSTMDDESPVGAVEEMSGSANVIRADGSSEQMTLGTPIYKGDVIETSANGAVNIVFIDETSMAVSENARLAVDEYSFNPATESGETNLSVLRGVFVFTSGLIGRDDPDDVMIETPVGSIGIRGTIIAGHINPGGESEITVMEGAIVIKNGTMETTLSQQYESVQLHGFHDKIHNTGIKDAKNMGKTYGSVSNVIPKLFSSINDTAKEEKHKNENQKEAKEEVSSDEKLENKDNNEEESKDVKTEEKLENHPDESNKENSFKKGTEFKQKENIKLDMKLNHDDRYQNHDDHHSREGKKSFSFDLNHFQGPRNTENVTFNFQTKPVFEYGKAGDVVAKLFIGNAPLGVAFTLSDATNYDIVKLNNGYAEVRLNSAGEAIANNPAGAALGSTVVTATFANGHVGTWTINPITVDASINIGGPQGLDVEVNNIGIASLQTKTFDLNNDGRDETIVGSPNVSHIFVNDGQVSVTDGQTAITTALNNPSPAASDFFGQSIDSIGDYNGDGRTDFIVGQPGNSGKAFIYTDNTGNPATTIIDNVSGGGNGFGAFVAGLGDVNGDGLSDVLVGSNGGNNEAYVFFGGNSSIITNSLSPSQGFKILTGANEIIAGGFVGDTNGDGFDDFAISLEMGANVNTYIIYGKNGFSGTIDMAYLENPDHALKIHHNGAQSDADLYGYNVGSTGDVNGDGLDDIQVGVTGGNQYIVHGHLNDMGGTVPYVTDGTATDGSGSTTTRNGIVGASLDGQSLVDSQEGPNNIHFMDNSHEHLRMQGGSGNNHFSIVSNASGDASFKSIDGGNGFDTIRANNNIDFSAINFEQISQIERLQVGADNTTITLTAENIFNLLKSSDDGTLKIESQILGSGSARGLSIIGAAATYTPDTNGIISALEDHTSGLIAGGTVTATSNANYDIIHIGDYSLYIDNSLTVSVTA